MPEHSYECPNGCVDPRPAWWRPPVGATAPPCSNCDAPLRQLGEMVPDFTPDVERCAAALRMVRRTSRCPEFVATALAEFERRQTPDTARAIVDATDRLAERADVAEYVAAAVLQLPDVLLDAEVARPGPW